MAVTPHYDLGLFTPLGVGWREDATAGALLDADMMLIDAALYELSQSVGSVTSVNGQTGVVVLTAAEVGADASGAAATAQSTAETFATNAVATETSRAESAEALLAPKASPTFTGTVSGITYTMVGADASGAAATAQSTAETFATNAVATETSRAETAEALLAPIASPAFTGTPSLPTGATAVTQSPLNASTKVATTAYADAAIAAAKAAGVTVNAQGSSVSAYTAVLGDANNLVTMSDGSASTFTVPPNSSVAFPVGTVLTVIQYGAGQITLTQGSGVTFYNPSSLTTRAQYSTVALVQVSANTWVAGGDLS